MDDDAYYRVDSSREETVASKELMDKVDGDNSSKDNLRTMMLSKVHITDNGRSYMAEGG